MKTILKTISVILILIKFTALHAQMDILTPKEELQYHKELPAKVEYILEGKVIKQIKFSKNHEVLWGYIFQITKIYKGYPFIKMGTIKIIQSTGEYESYTLPNGYIALGSRTQDVTPLLFSTGCSYIVFADQGYSEVLDTVVTDNSHNISVGEDPIVFNKDSTAQWGDYGKFLTIDSVYSFLKTDGLTVQEERK